MRVNREYVQNNQEYAAFEVNELGRQSKLFPVGFGNR